MLRQALLERKDAGKAFYLQDSEWAALLDAKLAGRMWPHLLGDRSGRGSASGLLAQPGRTWW